MGRVEFTRREQAGEPGSAIHFDLVSVPSLRRQCRTSHEQAVVARTGLTDAGRKLAPRDACSRKREMQIRGIVLSVRKTFHEKSRKGSVLR
jgi:hypothetical protein